MLLFALAAFEAGCKKFTDINQNPNQPLSVTPNVVLSAALTGSASNLATDFFGTARWMGYWSRSGNYIADVQTETYAITTNYADADFQRLYNTLSRYAYIETTAVANKNSLSFYLGVAKTMEALHFSTLVDGFGNVPYSQAFQVAKITTPKYDDAKTIYQNLISSLDSAVTYFDAAKTYYAASTTTAGAVTTDDKYDIIFGRGAGGSSATAASTRMDKWVMLANTIKLKLLLHVSGDGHTTAPTAPISGFDITGEIAKIVANGRGFLPVGLSATVNPGYSASSAAQFNPFWGAFHTVSGTNDNYNYYRGNTYSINYLNVTNDVRLSYFYAAAGSSILGSFDGDPQAGTNSTVAGIGPGVLKSPSMDQPILMDFESLFLQAEATQRGLLTGGPTAGVLLQQAVEENYIYLGDTGADADAYITGNAGNPAVDISAGDPQQAIITQKWAALNAINWFETYTEYRRTGYPVATILGLSHANSHIKNAIPYRFFYPQSEVTSNGANIPALANGQYTPIFWDTLDH